jgi:hypothetical protein
MGIGRRRYWYITRLLVDIQGVAKSKTNGDEGNES